MRRLVTLAASILAPAVLAAQTTPAPAPTIDFSGVLFGQYQVQTDAAAKAATGGEAMHRFFVERAYLTFRMPAGERGSIRVTADLFPATTGMSYRLKYGFFQYELTKNLFGVGGLGAQARLGMLQTVVIEHIETHWPRWLGITSVERAGYFSSADLGVATTITLPNRKGELYATVVNGSGYSAQEADRFKDIAARFTWTPFGASSGFLRTLAISPWYSMGASASAFTAAPNAISEGMQKDRRGVFLGLRERRLTAGVDISQRLDEIEAGAPPTRTVADRTGGQTSVFAIVRPVEIMTKKQSRLALIARMDRFQIDNDLAAATPNNRFVTLGGIWDLNQRTSFAIDFQETAPQGGTTTAVTKSLFLHWVAYF